MRSMTSLLIAPWLGSWRMARRDPGRPGWRGHLSRLRSTRMLAQDPERPDGSVRLRRVAVDPDNPSGEGRDGEGGGEDTTAPGVVWPDGKADGAAGDARHR